MFVFVLPEIGEGVVEGEIVKWLVVEGDTIRKDQPVAEVMTDKATVEITSPRAGRISRRHGSEGTIIKVHTPLVDIEEGAGAAPAPAAHAPKAAPAAPAPAPKAAPVAVPVKAPVAAPAGLAAPVAAPVKAPVASLPVAEPAARSGAKTLATPAVRSHARSADVDIAEVPGSGKGGRVTHQDIEAFVAHPAEVKAPPAVQAPAPVQGDERVRIIGLRRKIAEKMVQSYQSVPHFCYVDEVDCTNLYALRKELAPLAEQGGVKLTYIPFIIKALCKVFREFPTVNAVMDEAAFELVLRSQVNIGIATDSPAGLYVPVVKDCANKSILELAAEIADLSLRTRQGKVSLAELQGGSFTITSVGNIGGRFATPIINSPEVAILGVNQIHDRPMAIDGAVVIRKMMYLSPSFDHRVIDGAVAARFVSALKAVLEQPTQLLLELR